MLGPMSEVVLHAREMSTLVAFYRDRLGLRVVEPEIPHEADHAFWVRFDTGACQLTLHSGGMGSVGEDPPKIVFAVTNIDSVREQLIAIGVEIGPIRSPALGVHIADFADPEGNRLALESRDT